MVWKPRGGNIDLGDFKVRDSSCDPRLQNRYKNKEPDKRNTLSSHLVYLLDAYKESSEDSLEIHHSVTLISQIAHMQPRKLNVSQPKYHTYIKRQRERTQLIQFMVMTKDLKEADLT